MEEEGRTGELGFVTLVCEREQPNPRGFRPTVAELPVTDRQASITTFNSIHLCQYHDLLVFLQVKIISRVLFPSDGNLVRPSPPPTSHLMRHPLFFLTASPEHELLYPSRLARVPMTDSLTSTAPPL